MESQHLLRQWWLQLEVLIVQIIIFPLAKRRKKENLVKEEIKRILIITTTAIGDTLMCTPAIRAVRNSFPGAFIADLVHMKRKEILEDNPYIDKLIFYQGKWKKTFKLLAALKQESFDVIVILHANDPDIVPIAFLSRPKMLIGCKESKFNYLLDEKIEHEREGFNFVEQRFAFLRNIGVRDAQDYKKDIFIPEEKIQRCKKFLKQHKIAPQDLIIVFHPGASVPARRWSTQKFAALGDEINKLYKAKIIIMGGLDLTQTARYIYDAMQDKPIIVAGNFDLKESAALLKRANVMVTADSGPAHLASAVGTPLVVLFGPISSETTRLLFSQTKSRLIEKEIPCRRPCKVKECREKKHMCMELITVKEVLQMVKELLEKEHKPSQNKGNKDDLI